MNFEAKFQIGKSGVTEGIIESLELIFKTHERIRISVLKSAQRDKEKVRQMADEIVSKLNGNYKHKIIGFTILVMKLKKPNNL